jgi:hypothetical protein
MLPPPTCLMISVMEPFFLLSMEFVHAIPAFLCPIFSSTLSLSHVEDLSLLAGWAMVSCVLLPQESIVFLRLLVPCHQWMILWRDLKVLVACCHSFVYFTFFLTLHGCYWIYCIWRSRWVMTCQWRLAWSVVSKRCNGEYALIRLSSG